ncbi:MAG: hypothetical protein AAB597_01340, partial [Patescibacteria group bacterium]
PLDCSRGDFFLSEKIVTVVTSWIAPDGRYPLPLPILPTTGGAKLSTLSLSKGLPLASLGTLNFVTACGRQNWRVFGLSSANLAHRKWLQD